VSATLVLDNETMKKPTPSDGTMRGFGAKTILFNDNIHTFEEVAGQLVKAIRCSYTRGITLANQVHTTGSAIVYTGHLERCEAVAMVLEQIGLTVSVDR
jgi:ATP-dependent Clp protease adaptor protein ClpS